MDYSSMKATKTSKSSSQTSITVSKTTSKKVKKTLKNSSVAWVVVAIVLVVGVACGFFVPNIIFANDTYEMVTYANGEADVVIGSEETYSTYTELGVKCIAFGKDYSSDFIVTYYYRSDLTEDEVQVDGVDESTPGIYYAVYTSPAKKYSSVTLIRNIIVLGEEDDG